MDKNPQGLSLEIASKIGSIESLIEKKKFKEALAEIRDLESQKIIEQFSIEKGHIHYLLSLVFHHLGRYAEALEEGKRAFELLKDTSENERIAEIQFTLGCIYVALGDFEHAESELRDVIATYRRIDDKHGIITVHNKLANICFIRSNFDKAIEYINQCIKYCDESEDETTKAKLAANVGRIYVLIGRWQAAKDNLLSAVKVFEEKSNELYLCQALLSLGYVFYLQRDFVQAKSCYEKGLKIIFKNSYAREFTIYHEYSGELAFAQGDYVSAKNHYLDCIGRMEEIAPESDMISQTYRLLAELQIAEKQYDLALSSCEKALKVATSLDEKIEIGAIHRALGQIYTAKSAGVVVELARHELAKAKESYEKSISILEKIGAKFELGKSYLEAGRSKCFEYFDRLKILGKAEDVFEELESGYHVGQVNLALSQLFFENNETQKSQLFLNSAEKTFRSHGSCGELSEEKELKLVSELRKKLSPTSSISRPPQAMSFSDIITQNPEMLSVIEKANQIKDSHFTILLEGETGTGKDFLAKAIHFESDKRNQPFVPVNCAAIPRDLVESELFGYKKGAFTGATTDKKGLLEEAEGGTLFLNEVVDVPSTTQAKLLSAIEEKQLTRLGETKSRRVDFRVIAASNKDLDKEVKAENFREDLYYRLSVIKLVLPPLRERKGDIPLLVDHFLKKHFGEKADLSVHSRILKIFEDYDWPGNVRELENEIIKLISLKREENGNGFKHLPDKFFSSDESSQSDPPEGDSSLYDQVTQYEKKLILKALEENDWIKTKAAKALKMPAMTLSNKIKKYHIETPI